MNDKTRVENIDCMIRMRETPDKFYELAIVDPPYGIKEKSNRVNKQGAAVTKRKIYHQSLWDCSTPDDEYLISFLT